MLLNTDHKIITKMLTARLKPYLNKIISKSQMGYVPNRFIGMNLRKLIDMLLYLERKGEQAVLLSVDYYKCFDSIEHSSLVGALKFFNIGDKFIAWIQMLYHDFKYCVINNGRWSRYEEQCRGVHQGSALSGPIFLYVAEILAMNIKKNLKIKGIQIGKETETISQYTDDTNIWSIFEQESINKIVNELEIFYQNTGLCTNYEKSVIYKVGSVRLSTKRLYLSKKFKWSNSKIDILGLIIAIEDTVDMEKMNFNEILEKAISTLKMWSKRKTLLAGKILVINTLVISLFVYKMQVLPTISKELEAKILAMISDYIWNGRKPKIKLKTLMNNVDNGGFGLANIRIRDIALKVEWIRRLHSQEMDPVLTMLAYWHINAMIKCELLWECNFNENDCELFACTSLFWKSVLQAWATVNYHEPSDHSQIANQIIWYNSHIKVENKFLLIPQMYESGIFYLKDLLNKGKFMKVEQLNECYNIKVNMMAYNQLISAIPRTWKMSYILGEDTEYCSLYQELIEKPKWSQVIYQKIIKSKGGKDGTVLKATTVLSRNLKMPILTQEIQKAFRNIKKTTDIAKYRSFQHRLLHNVVYLNNRLVYLGISDTNQCYYCKQAKEEPMHFFWECQKASEIWRGIRMYIIEMYKAEPNLSVKLVMLNTVDDNPYSFINLIVCITKQMLFGNV